MSQSEGQPILRTENLTKKFGKLTAVDQITMSFNQDQICGLIGPNGAGKTTLVNLLTGGLETTEGKIYFNGEEITDADVHEITQSGLVRTFQVSNTFETLSVYDNVRLSLQAQNSPYNFWRNFDADEGLKRKAQEIVERFGLEEIADKNPSVLSHGDARKVEIAVAVACDPEMILLDEPSSGMSGGELTELTELLLSIGEDIPMLIIEHNLEITRKVCDRLIVLNKGQLLAEGDPATVRNDNEVRQVYFGDEI